MPTSDMSDEELDELVRRSAEAYPEELPLGNWLRMEDKLHTAATERLVRQRLWRFFGLEVAVVALLLLLWQGYRAVSTGFNVTRHDAAKALATTSIPTIPSLAPTHSTQRETTLQIGPTSTAQSSPSISTSGGTARKHISASPEPTSLSVAAAPLPFRGEAKQMFSGQVLAATPAPQRRMFAVRTGQQPLTVLGHETTARLLATPTQHLYSGSEPIGSAWRPAQPTASVAEILQLEVHGQDLTQHFLLPLTLPLQDTLAHVTAVPPGPADSAATRPERPATSFYRVVVGITGAPAWSAVRTLNTAQLGGNLGLTLEYRLTSRLRLRTGLIRSIKRYEAASSDYTPLPAWNWRPGSYEVYANCRITEIPLDLRYDIVRQPTYTVFAGAGLTSLLMRHERYAYDYNVNGQIRTAAAKVVNGSNYAFGLFTASVGAERALGSRWSVQAEPFLQLPLGSVGAGKVRLSSAGASFSIKYGLLR